MWTARVSLVCVYLVEKHTPNHVTYHASPNPDISPPTLPSFPEPALLSPIPSFSLGIDFNPIPPVMHTESPSHTIGHIDHRSFPPTSSTGSSSVMDPPHADHVQSEAQQLLMNVHNEQAAELPADPEGCPKRTSKAPTCGIGGHKHGHKASPKAPDQGHARPPPPQAKYYTIQ